MNKSYQHWIIEVKDKIAFLTFNRPKEQNRIDNTTLSELQELAHDLNTSSDIWVVILRAAGDCFSAGVDVSLIGSLKDQESQTYQKNLRTAQAALDTFESIEKPIIAALHGHVIGGGMILALCCDFRIAADNVNFGLPEVKRSIGVIMGTQRITRTIGVAHTKEMVMLGQSVDAKRALHIGLVNRVVPLDQLDNECLQLAEHVLRLPPLAVGLCKKIINDGMYLERSGQDLEIEAQEALLKTEDFKEAISSFYEKRKPIYKGQ